MTAQIPPAFRPFRLLAIDPGFAALGIALVTVEQRVAGKLTFHVEAAKLIETTKDDRKSTVLAADDNVIRLLALHGKLAAFYEEAFAPTNPHRHLPLRALCAEGQSWPRSASVAAKVGMAWGVLASFAASYALPVFQLSPQKVKKQLCGKLSASKEEVAAEVHRRTGFAALDVPASKREHLFDAVAVALALPVHPGWPLLAR